MLKSDDQPEDIDKSNTEALGELCLVRLACFHNNLSCHRYSQGNSGSDSITHTLTIELSPLKLEPSPTLVSNCLLFCFYPAVLATPLLFDKYLNIFQYDRLHL